MSRYDPVADALCRRQAEGRCLFCGGELSERKLTLPGRKKGETEKVCLNEGCGRGKPRGVRLHG